jgi:hypothetical protein
MRSGDTYRDMARELLARAGNHPNAQQRAKLETTAAEWLRLADEVDRTDRLAITYEATSPTKNA